MLQFQLARLGALLVIIGVTAFPAVAQTPPTVQVTVQAIEAHGNPLTYQWRVTDGSIRNIAGSAITWRLPTGPGLHFAYVLVSNGKGGYTERRIAVSTDTIGAPLVVPPPVAWSAPPAPPAVGNSFTSILRSGAYFSPIVPTSGASGVYTQNAEAFMQNRTGTVTTPIVRSDARGYFTIPRVRNGTWNVFCRIDATVPFQPCATDIPMTGNAVLDPYMGPQDGREGIVGRLLLADGTACGTNNEFFGKLSLGRASLLNAANAVIDGPHIVNPFGHYSFAANAAASKIKLECEGANPVTVPVPVSPAGARTLLADSSTPIVQGMSAKLNGVEVGLFLPPPSGKPSDNVPGADFFLSFKGIDSRLSACRYYASIGAVQSCTVNGNFTGAIGFEDWKRATGMSPYLRAGGTEYTSTYINRIDLNLTRNHHSVSYNVNHTAAYVCNHLGPADETQASANIAIADAVAGRNLVACVAMDYTLTPGVNGNLPFTRFMIFGPDGSLLPSVNLDGRREKFVPGVCVSCHGGDHYSGHFSISALGSPFAGSADLGAHFLPYDTENFVFSTTPGLRRIDQEEAIYRLNQNVLQAGPTPAETALINGWYAASHVLDKNYMPPSWSVLNARSRQFYHYVYARSCRTCHVAFTEALNFDDARNMFRSPAPVHETGKERTGIAVCGASRSWLRTFSMPNSLRTLDLFWGSKGTSVDQPAILEKYLGFECNISPSPVP